MPAKKKTTRKKRSTPKEQLNIPWPSPPCKLQQAVDLVEEHADRVFTLKEAVQAIRKNARVRNPDPEDHIRSLLSEAGNLARIPESDIFIPTSLLFKDAAFYISLTELELAEGILVPGHRFSPFLSERILPYDAVLCDENGAPFPKKDYSAMFGDLMIYHSLLGMQDMLMVCPPMSEFSMGESEFMVETQVYDLSDFYRAHQASSKGLLLLRVQDYASGKLELTYADTQTQFTRMKDARERDKALGDRLVNLMEINGFCPPVQLIRDAYASLFHEGIDLSKPASPFGPWMAQSNQIALSALHHRPCLVPEGEDPEEFYGSFDMPDYDGRCETMEDLFHKAGLSLELSYVRAVILDHMNQGGEDTQAVTERLMKDRLVPQWDGDDWRFFNEELNVLWNELIRNYKKLSPNKKIRALRSRILEQCDQHLSLLRGMDGMFLEVEDLPMEEMKQLAMGDHLCMQMLHFLENHPDSEEIEMMSQQFDAVKDTADMLQETVEESIEGKGEIDQDMLMELLAEGELEMEDEELSFEDPVKSYVLKVSFKHIKGVSRTIEIAGPQSMHMFHQMIQHAIDWDDDHMYSFFMSNKAWDQTSEIACPFGESEETSDDITFDDLKLKPKQKFLYLFDYGDNHEFEVEVVKINSDAPEQYPDWEDNDE